jgi:hypothetical protein
MYYITKLVVDITCVRAIILPERKNSRFMASKAMTESRHQVGRMEPNRWSSEVLLTGSPEAAESREPRSRY